MWIKRAINDREEERNITELKLSSFYPSEDDDIALLQYPVACGKFYSISDREVDGTEHGMSSHHS